MKKIIIIFILVIFNSCVSMSGLIEKHNKNGMETAKNKASFLLECDKSKISTVVIEKTQNNYIKQIGAFGCNKPKLVFVYYDGSWLLEETSKKIKEGR